MENFAVKTCSNCGSAKFKSWEDLTEDEKFVIKRLPDKAKFSMKDRKKQHFCKRCLYIDSLNNLLV